MEFLVLWIASKSFSTGVHLDAYVLILFKLGMMIDIEKVYILMLVLVMLAGIQGHFSPPGTQKKNSRQQGCEKAKISTAIMSSYSQSFERNLVCC